MLYKILIGSWIPSSSYSTNDGDDNMIVEKAVAAAERVESIKTNIKMDKQTLSQTSKEALYYIILPKVNFWYN